MHLHVNLAKDRSLPVSERSFYATASSSKRKNLVDNQPWVYKGSKNTAAKFENLKFRGAFLGVIQCLVYQSTSSFSQYAGIWVLAEAFQHLWNEFHIFLRVLNFSKIYLRFGKGGRHGWKWKINNNKKKNRRDRCLRRNSPDPKPICPPSYFTLLPQQLSLLLPEKNSSSFLT